MPFFVSEDLVNAYSDDDLRKGTYIVYNGYGWTYKKIYWASAHYGTACSVSDNYFFRTSEAYLNLAEAAAMSGDEGTARQMLAQSVALVQHQFDDLKRRQPSIHSRAAPSRLL